MVAFRSTDTSGRTSGLLLRCVLYCLLALGLIIVDKRYDHLGKIRRWLSWAAYPVQVAVASPFEGWHWFRESVSSRDSLRVDKARLEAELRVAEFKLQRYEALEAETQRLRILRENTASVADHFLIGDIMDVDLDAFRERVLVNLGASSGVFVGQAVLDSGGVFGQVARVEQFTSEVILVSDPAHAIPVQINRNGLRTVAVGSGDTSRLKLPYLPTSADVVVGDLIVTSGLGGGFPPGYPVGTVSAVRRDPAQSLAEVELRPAAALDRAREVMFVWLKPNAALASSSLATPGGAPATAAATRSSAASSLTTPSPAASPSAAPSSAAPSSAVPSSAVPSSVVASSAVLSPTPPPVTPASGVPLSAIPASTIPPSPVSSAAAKPAPPAATKSAPAGTAKPASKPASAPKPTSHSAAKSAAAKATAAKTPAAAPKPAHGAPQTGVH